MKILSQWYTFELRGSIFVKGKDNMTTYLVVGRKWNAFIIIFSLFERNKPLCCQTKYPSHSKFKRKLNEPLYLSKNIPNPSVKFCLKENEKGHCGTKKGLVTQNNLQFVEWLCKKNNQSSWTLKCNFSLRVKNGTIWGTLVSGLRSHFSVSKCQREQKCQIPTSLETKDVVQCSITFVFY